MASNPKGDPTYLFSEVRAFVLAGGGVWSVIAFWLLGVVSFAFLSLSILFGMDTIIGFSPFLPQFNLLINSDPHGLVAWLDTAMVTFEAARGHTSLDPVSWLILALVCAILFFAHMSRFAKPHGESLLDSPEARPVARTLLDQFGYFRDIQFPFAANGIPVTDFFAYRNVFFAPKGQVSRILKGKPSDNQQKVVTFFMAHEYAHAVTRDNLANSVFLVVVSLLVFMFLFLFGPIMVYGAAIMGNTPLGPLVGIPITLVLFVLFCAGVVSSFYGMAISYIKAREFFADQAAFRFVDVGMMPYGDLEDRPRPSAFSALSSSISPYERALHHKGVSLHARNLLVFFWGFCFGIRSLYILVAPKELCWTVLGFDLLALVAFAGLFVTLPKRPDAGVGKPSLPWLLTFLAIFAIEMAGPGQAGAVKMLNSGFFSNGNAQLMGIPGLSLFVIFFFGCLFFGFKKLAALGHSSENRLKGSLLRRFLLFSVQSVSAALGFFVFCVVGLIFCLAPLGFFLHARFFDAGLLLTLGALGLLIVGLVLLFHQYRLFFVSKLRLFVAVVLAETVIVFALVNVAYIVDLDVLVGARQGEVRPQGDLHWLVHLFSKADWSPALYFAAISTIFYLALRVVGFVARVELTRIEKTMTWGSNR
ncbi:M48 family metalloprotease [uncultured Cohaesibacter sp.]|uniref:M48 family metalloprotease n=1 Tax=uncultured Cohaesibacter sp. TaxID=1002546 RepID=UPI002930F675|nr:M48 family metalloprotease [uncultured Cohaesibacter sp.]